jgi:hypothetical protein
MNLFRILMGKPLGERPLGKLRRRCVDNIKIDLGETGNKDVRRMELAHDRVWY